MCDVLTSHASIQYSDSSFWLNSDLTIRTNCRVNLRFPHCGYKLCGTTLCWSNLFWIRKTRKTRLSTLNEELRHYHRNDPWLPSFFIPPITRRFSPLVESKALWINVVTQLSAQSRERTFNSKTHSARLGRIPLLYWVLNARFDVHTIQMTRAKP